MRARPLSLSLLISMLLAIAAALPAAAQQKVGVNAAVNPDASGTPPGGTVRKLVIGQEVVHNEHIVTDAKGQTQILFLDGSSVSVGPNADLTIDDFVYDPSTGTGKMTLTAVQGAMRFVGGKLSKQENAVTLHIGTATIGVRGGVFFADVQRGGKAEVIFVYGKGVKVSGQSGCSTDLYRPGFAVDINDQQGCAGSAYLAPPGTTAAILTQLDGQIGMNGGATTVPTNATVANSGVPNTVSNNVTVSIQSAGQNSPPLTPPPTPTVTPPQVPTNQIQIASSQSQTVVTKPTSPTPTPPLAQPFPNTTGISGGLDVLGNANPALGFTNLVMPFANATVQNGVLTGTFDANSASIPLAQGTATFSGNGSYSPVGALEGTTVATPDNTFFYADLAPISDPSNTIFVYGGTPVNVSAYQPPGTPQFLAFQIHQDPVLQSPVPFVPDQFSAAGTNPTVSPLFIAVSPTVGFDYQVSGTALSKALQASLGISGQGANQSSVLMVAVGNIFSSGLPVLNGVAEGTYTPGGGNSPVLISTAYITPQDGAGASFYGGNTISGFVLEPTCCAGVGGGQTSPIAILQATQPLQTTNFGFAQPVTSITAPAIATGPQTTQSLTGYAAGIMTHYTTGGSPLSYVFTGATAIQTDATNLQIAATIAGADPFTPSVSGVNSMSLSFGSLTPGGTNGRQGYINDNLFGTLESPGGSGSTLNGNSSTANIYLVTNTAVAGAINSILPSGVSVCSCQYLQWGYWGGQLSTASGGETRVDAGAINTWVAGIPTVTMPTVGTGTYSGAAIGTVSNNGAVYVAAGGFTNTFNFGNNTGSVAITNFDGQNFSGTVIGGSHTPIYAGAISGGNKQGSLAGSFYGPGAAETGGSFSVQATSGAPYLAAGTFAGKLTGPIH